MHHFVSAIMQTKNSTSLTHWNMVFLENPIAAQLFKKFPTFYAA